MHAAPTGARPAEVSVFRKSSVRRPAMPRRYHGRTSSLKAKPRLRRRAPPVHLAPCRSRPPIAPTRASPPSARSSPTTSRAARFPRRRSCAFATSARPPASAWTRSPTPSGWPTSPASSRCPAISATPLALRYHGHQFRVYNPDLGDGRGFLFAQLREVERAGPPARSRHQGLGPHALVARRRRPAHPQGRRARGAGHRHARGAGRSDLALLLPGRDRRGAAARRRAQPDPLGGADPPLLEPHPLRHLPAPRRPRARRSRRPARRPRDRQTYYPDLAGARQPGRGPAGRGGRRAPRAWPPPGWRPASSTACSTPTT